eukprot:TRINITY_DN71798_c0_g1_i1.p1 TRINITY_DN71798_c0_g1~~TRINITY_DN71798_c0_g1_i1.p1  ORF type:complete len:219 (+),score=40.09 TRINITY_DN71798_c0_g1_i1:64-657(+)
MPGAYVWMSFISGTLMGLLVGLMSGPGKLLPFHPMFKKMKLDFEKLTGPFFGLPGDLVRVIIGLAELAAGWGILVALWGGGVFGVITGDLLNLGNCLTICAGIGLIVIFVGALWYHVVVDGSPGPTPVFLVLLFMLVGSRLQVTPMDGFSSEHQTIIKAFSAVSVVGLIGTVIMRCVGGKTAAELRAVKEELDKPIE